MSSPPLPCVVEDIIYIDGSQGALIVKLVVIILRYYSRCKNGIYNILDVSSFANFEAALSENCEEGYTGLRAVGKAESARALDLLGFGLEPIEPRHRVLDPAS